MKQRIITGTVMGVVTAGVFVGAYFFNPIINVIFGIIALLAMYECLKVADLLKYRAMTLVSLAYTLACNILIFYNFDSVLPAVSLVALVLEICVLVIYRLKEKCSFAETAEFALLTVYVTAGFGTLIMLFQSFKDPLGKLLMVMLVLLGSWCCDIGGWLFGVTMGKHKLCPKISPKKSVEGLIGSIVFSFIALLAIGFISRALLTRPFNIVLLAIIALPFAIFELMGDLAASVLKREHNVKDFGTIFPAHGGIMDRFDGVVMTSLFVYLVSRVFNFF